MKTLILFLLSALTSYAATTYPVLTDVPQRTFTGGGTNLALLSGTNVYTGTNTFTASSFYPANKLAIRTLFTTNIYLASVAGYVATTPTNAGDYALITGAFEVTLPALVSTNSRVGFNVTQERTNANTSAVNYYWYAGNSTNFVSGAGNTYAASVGRNSSLFANTIFENYNSLTTQLQGGSSTLQWGALSLVDTSAPWKLFLAFQTSTTATNILIPSLTVFEFVQ